MRGRKPKPTALKLLAGNPGKRPLNDREPEPEARAPRMPPWLSKEAKAEWKRIVPVLLGLRVLTVADRAALECYCQAHAELQRATALLDKEGIVYDAPVYDKEGNEVGARKVKHPAVSLQRDALRQVRAFLTEFGLSPSSRSRVKVTHAGNSEKASPLQAILARGREARRAPTA